MDTSGSYAMHEFSEAAKKRSDLFASIAQQQGFRVLPGRYGGEYNNDMLAILHKDWKTTLLLGLKVTGSDGGLQLDMLSLGPHRQFSPEWLRVLVYSLGVMPAHKDFADQISTAIESNNLLTVLMYLDKADGQVKLLPISQDTE